MTADVTLVHRNAKCTVSDCQKLSGVQRLKITILDKQPGEEDEIIVKCAYLDENISRLLNQFKMNNGKQKLALNKNSQIVLIEPDKILYFESVDDKVFAYTKDSVYECKSKLYVLEEELSKTDFFRASKAQIVNVNKIKSITPAFSGRFEALLENDYKIIISRNYVPELKKLLGV